MADAQLERLNQTFDTSSEKNRNFLFGFLAVQLYVLVTVGGTTDLDLVLASSSFNLPVVNIPVPLVGFYFFAPLLLLLLHINLLFNLSEHVILLDDWLKSGGNTKTRFPYVVNVIACMKHEQRAGIQLMLVKGITFFSIIVIPLFNMLFIQFQFSAYHNIWITICQAMFFLANLWVLNNYLYNLKIELLRIPQGGIVFNKLLMVIPIKPVRISAKWIRSAIHFVAVSLSLGNILMLIGALWIPNTIKNFDFLLSLTPTIDVHEQSIAKINPLYANTITPKITSEHQQIWTLYKPVDLKGRHFELANFESAQLYSADLREANLTGAYMFGVKLQGANMAMAQLSGAFLKQAKLHKVILKGANLEKANLSKANLDGAQLVGANLQNATLSYVNLRSADLLGAKLQGASLLRARLHGAVLVGAKMQGANLEGSILYGANLIRTSLEGAILKDASFIGANMSTANLEGAALQRTLLQGANLKGIVASYCILNKTQVFATKQFQPLSECVGSIYSESKNIYDAWGDEVNVPEIWDNTINSLKKEMPNGELKVRSLARVQAAKDYAISLKTDPLADEVSEQLANANIEEFTTGRLKLACSDKWIAKGIRGQHPDEKGSVYLVNKGTFDKQLQQLCPEIAEFVP